MRLTVPIRLTEHVKDQMKERHVSEKEVCNAVWFGQFKSGGKDGTTRKQLGEVVVVYYYDRNAEEVVVVTAWRVREECKRVRRGRCA